MAANTSLCEAPEDACQGEPVGPFARAAAATLSSSSPPPPLEAPEALKGLILLDEADV